jgi:myosin-6
MLDLAELVWARDPIDGYVQGKIVELGATEYEVVPVEKGHQKKKCSIDDIYPSCNTKSDHDDNCE